MLQYYGLYLEKKMDLVMSYDSNATLMKKYKYFFATFFQQPHK